MHISRIKNINLVINLVISSVVPILALYFFTLWEVLYKEETKRKFGPTPI